MNILIDIDRMLSRCYTESINYIRDKRSLQEKVKDLPKEQNSQASGFPDEDCKWMWLWRTFLKGTAEGAMRAKGVCVPISQAKGQR